MRPIDGDRLMMHLTDWWYSSFGQVETDESKAIKTVMDKIEQSLGGFALEKQEQDRWRPCNEKPEYDFQNVLVRWHDKRKGCEKDYYIFEGYVVRGIWCGLFEDVDISDFEPIEWKPLEPYTEVEQ